MLCHNVANDRNIQVLYCLRIDHSSCGCDSCNSLQHVTSFTHDRPHFTAHSFLWTGRTTAVNALSQSILSTDVEKKEHEAAAVSYCRQACQKNRDKKQKRHLRKIGFLPIFASEKRCGRVVDIEFLSEIERKHAQWTPHAMAP